MHYLYILLFSTSLFAQQYVHVDFRSVFGKISLNPDKKEIYGSVVYDFDIMQMVDTIYIDAQKMQFENVKMNGQKIDFKNSGKKIAFYNHHHLGKNILSFDYISYPKQAIYFNNFDNNWQIWTQGQGKYTSNWFPSFDDVNEKLIFNLDVSFKAYYQVISNGILQNQHVNNNDNSKVWQYRMQKPMSSYLLMLTIGKYERRNIKSKSGIPIELYIETEDLPKFEPTYRHTKQIFDFLEKEIGVKYPWQIYKQVPVKDFLYAGMENTTATIFSREYVVDSLAFNDRNYIDVNAHELAHQWFGNLVTAKSGQHHWLQEGFATYYALLAQKQILGKDYFYHQLYDYLQEFKSNLKNDATPVLNEKASSMTFYKKGAWVLFVLQNDIGEKKFQKAIKNYLTKYSFQSVETDDFLNEINKICNYDTAKFRKIWLESAIFDFDKANSIILKNKTIEKLLELQKMRDLEFKNKKKLFETILKSDSYYTLKEEILFQMQDLTYDLTFNLLDLALKTKNLNTRQALAESVIEITESFRFNYETLLIDKSYKTKQTALVNLINNFPDDRKKYLDKTRNISGFNDKGFEMLWINLALSTPNFISNPEEFLDKLSDYSSNKYEFSVRQNAFIYLNRLDVLKEQNLLDLVDCCLLPNWRHAKWSKEFLKLILKNDKIKSDYSKILPDLITEKQTLLNRFMNEK